VLTVGRPLLSILVIMQTKIRWETPRLIRLPPDFFPIAAAAMDCVSTPPPRTGLLTHAERTVRTSAVEINGGPEFPIC